MYALSLVFHLIVINPLKPFIFTCSSPTEEAVNDAEEAAHGADHRGHHLVAPPGVVAAVRTPGAQLLVGQQQRLQGGRHGKWRGAEEEEAGTMRRRRSEQEGGGARGRLEGGAEPRGFTCEGGEEGQEKKKDDTVSAKTLIECIAKGEKKEKKIF